MKNFYTLFLFLVFVISAWGGEPTMRPVDGYPAMAMGGDLSWTSRIVDNDIYTYYTESSLSSPTTTIPDMAYDHGFDAVRLRVWVDPTLPLVSGDNWYVKIDGSTMECVSTHGYCGANDLLSLATTFAKKGTRIMVAFHLSDTFADPARQFIPKAWEDCSTVDELAEIASTYVQDVLQQLYDANVNVAWVQIGNETSSGMLKYNLPSTSNQSVSLAKLNCEISNANTTGTKNFVKVFNSCATAAKKIYPDAKTLIHIDEGNSWSKSDWVLSTLKNQGFNTEMCDLVGLSLYPCWDQNTSKWKEPTDNCLSTIDNIYENYGYRTIICEIGMNNEWSAALPEGTQAQGIEQCNKDVREFTQYLIDNLKSSNCEGFFYWEPETDYLDGYSMGACVSANPGNSWPRTQVTANDYWTTVKENSTFPAGGLTSYENASITGIIQDEKDAPIHYYNLQGIEVKNPLKGIYLCRQGNSTTKISM